MRRLQTLAAAAVVVLLAAPAFAGGEKCNEQHAQADYQTMAEKWSKKPYLGVETEKNAQGFYAVTAVKAGSPGEKAGLRTGDVLVALNGVKMTEANKEALKAAKAGLAPGKQATYTIERGGREQKITATYGEVPREVLAQWLGEHVLEHSSAVLAQN
jgi:S1-C subfamily serine protease